MPGALPGSGPLDGPPPSPNAGGPTPVGNGNPGMSGLAQPMPIGSQGIPPEVLTGILQASDKISGMFDAFAQVTPDLAADWDLCKQVLQRVLGKVLTAGGGPNSSTASGPQFPGGGINAGQPGATPGVQ